MDTLWQHEISIAFEFATQFLNGLYCDCRWNPSRHQPPVVYWIRGGTLFDLLLHLKPQCCSCCPSPLFPALPWLFPQNFKVLTNGNSMNCFYPFLNCNFQLKFWKFCRQVTMKRRQTLDLTTHKYRTLETASEVSVKLSKNQLKNVFF